MTLQNGDFIEVEYTGMLKEDGIVFDTTDEQVAQSSGVHNPNQKYGPVVICIHQHQVVPGVDHSFPGKNVGDEYVLDLLPEEAFGKKDAALIELIPAFKFKKENISPMVGMQVEVDNRQGVVKTASGGRVMVDFNHPLSGKEVTYTVKIIKKVDDPQEQVKAILEMNFHVRGVEVKVEGDTATVQLQKDIDIPEQVVELMSKNMEGIIPSVKKLVFNKPSSKQNKPSTQKQA
jgi:FKBP-type peptidyl-prolyl cis-trans isomerase 2